jgi:predicted PurR-regulated permease PerM
MRRRPDRRPGGPEGPDHEHVDTISSRTVIFVLVAAAVVLHAIRWVLLPFVISGLLAYLCTPVLDRLAAKTRMPRSLLACGMFVVLASAAALTGASAISALAPELAGVVTDAQGTLEGLARDLIGARTINLFGQSMNATQLAQAISANVLAAVREAGGIVDLGGFAVAGIFGLFLTLVLLLYFLLSGPDLARGLLGLVPPRQRPLIRHVWQRLDPILIRYLIGVAIVFLYATVAAYLGLGIVLAIPHAGFLALLTGLLELIPVIGPGAAAVIAGLIAVRHATGIGPIVAYAIYATVLRLSIDQLFGPLALGSAARLHPVTIIFSFLVGGILFGIVGVILAVPMALVIRTTLAILYDEPPDEEAPADA